MSDVRQHGRHAELGRQCAADAAKRQSRTGLAAGRYRGWSGGVDTRLSTPSPSGTTQTPHRLTAAPQRNFHLGPQPNLIAIGQPDADGDDLGQLNLLRDGGTG